jgi:HD-GYP domain-containing protein (c-di-GMP phosphodiesterase class II)
VRPPRFAHEPQEVASLPPPRASESPSARWEASPARAALPAIEPRRLPVLEPAEVVVTLSQALDLAEGRPMGHAQRVCYIASILALEVGLSSEERLGLFYAALFHDIGVPMASPVLSSLPGVAEDELFAASPLRSPEQLAGEMSPGAFQAVIQAFHQHSLLGARAIGGLDLPAPVVDIVLANHERWDGAGYPAGLAKAEIPTAARVLALADHAESLIAAEASPLAARRSLTPSLRQLSSSALDPALVQEAVRLCRRDDFWLGLYSDELAEALLVLRPAEPPRREKRLLLRFASAFASLVDARSEYTLGHSRLVAEESHRLARAAGLSPEHAQAVRVAALLHDLGRLGVPPRVIAKADILNVGEMHLLRQHPSYSRRILEDLRGMEEVALWVGAHHERPDGRGYPEMMSGPDIPLEARIIGLANVYVALIADRPYRVGLRRSEALKVLEGAAGTQLDPDLVRLFCSLKARARS